MQEYFIDTHEWKEFWTRWQDTVDKIPGLREEILKQVAARIQSQVRREIDVSGIHDSDGRVKNWQESAIGSRRGYVAVRPRSEKISGGYQRTQTKFYSRGKYIDLNSGALTNFLSSGHRVRGPSGRSKRYQRRARMTRVVGADFYPKAKAEAEKIALQEAEAVLQALREELRL